MKIISIFLFFIFLIGQASGGGGDEFPQSMEVNDGQLQTAQYIAKVNGQFYEIDTPDIEIEIQMVKKHPLIIDSEKEEHLLINDEDRGVLPPGNDALCIEAPGCVIYGNVGLRNRLSITKTGENSWRPQLSIKPNNAQQQHVRYYAEIDGRKYPTQGLSYDIDVCGTGLLVDGKFYKNAVPTGHINEINRIEERIPVLGSPSKDIPLIAAGDVQRNTARLHTNVVGQQILGSVSFPKIPIGGNTDYINAGHNKHDGKSTFGDTKREEKQKNKQKQQKRGKPMGGNSTHINNQNNKFNGNFNGGIITGGLIIGGNRNVGGTHETEELIAGYSTHINNQNNNFNGYGNGGIIRGGLNLNRNVGSTQEIGSTQGVNNRSITGDLANSLRQQRTEDNHISINGQIYSVDGPNVNVGVEGHDLSVNGRVYQNRATEQYLEIIQDKNIRNVIVSVPLSLFSRENITVGQTRHIHAECDGNLYIDQSADDCIRILCVDVKKDAAAKNFGSTSGGFNFGSTSVFYNFSVRGTLHIHNSSLECANIECDASLNVTHSPIERNAQMKCGGSLSIDESPMGNIRLNCDGSLRIEKSKMESSQIDVGGSIGIVKSPMGSIGIDCGGSLRIEKSKMEIGNLDCGGSLTIVESPAQNLQLDCGGSLNMKESPMKNVGINCGGSATIKKSKMESGRINCGGSFSIDRTPTGSVRINYGGSRINL